MSESTPNDQREARALLPVGDADFRLLVEGVRDYAVFMLDPAGRVISWNTGARLLKGYEADEIIGRHFSVFYPEQVAASGWPEQELRKALAGGRYEEEGWRMRKDGSRFWARVTITALWDASGRHRGFAKVTRDLTERRQASALEAEGQRLTAFIAMLAHELRNPLAPIANAVALLDTEAELSGATQLARDIIARQTRQMQRLVDDLLDISRITTDRLRLDTRPVALAGVVAAAVEAVRPLLDDRRHRLELDLAERDLWVRGDRARLIQILGNLLDNAAKFTPAGGTVALALERDGDSALIRVRDNGPGIAPERLPHLFDRFLQREDDDRKVYGGLGLGLGLAQRLALLQGGRIEARSRGVAGAGSEFTVRLPLIAAPPAAVDGGGVLVVDDNPDSADTLALLLTRMGYRASAAYSGEQALAEARRQRPRVVLMDIGLPDLDGIEVARRLAAEIAEPPAVIAVTGYGMDADRERSFKAGLHAHLTKPVDPQRLQAMLAPLLDAASTPATGLG